MSAAPHCIESAAAGLELIANVVDQLEGLVRRHSITEELSTYTDALAALDTISDLIGGGEPLADACESADSYAAIKAEDATGGPSYQQLASLEAKLAELQQQLATEVRTRRVVVIEEDGFERVVVGEMGGGEGGVIAYARPHAGAAPDHTGVGLWANQDEPWDGGGVAGLRFIGGGDARAVFNLRRLEAGQYAPLIEIDAADGEPGSAIDAQGLRVVD